MADNERLIYVSPEFYSELCELLKPEERWTTYGAQLTLWTYDDKRLVFVVSKESMESLPDRARTESE